MAMDCDMDQDMIHENSNHHHPHHNHQDIDINLELSKSETPLALKPIEYNDSMDCDSNNSNNNKPRSLFSLLLDRRKQSTRNRRRSKSLPLTNQSKSNNTNNYEDIEDKLSQEELRVVKDLKEISDSKWCARGTIVTIHLCQRLHNFKCTISPAEGYYRGGTFSFDIQIGKNYPFIPPQIIASHPIFHPNINLNTLQIGLPILSKEDWKPVLSLNDVLFALQLMFMQPNIDQIDEAKSDDNESQDDDDDEDEQMMMRKRYQQRNNCNRNQYSFGLNNHKPSYIPNVRYSSPRSIENSGIIQNMEAAMMFRDHPKQFEKVCQQIIRGGISMFGTNWQCIERKKMKNIFNHNNGEKYDPSLGSQSFKLKDTDKTILQKKCSVLRKRRPNEREDDEDVFRMDNVKQALRCFASTTGSIRDGIGSDSGESQTSLTNGIDRIELQPPTKKRRLNRNELTEQDLNAVNSDINTNNHNHNGFSFGHHGNNYQYQYNNGNGINIVQTNQESFGKIIDNNVKNGDCGLDGDKMNRNGFVAFNFPWNHTPKQSDHNLNDPDFDMQSDIL